MKKAVFISLLCVAGCQGNPFVGEPQSASERLAMMDKIMREQSGQIEVLQHENKKIKEEMMMIKSVLELKNTAAPTSLISPTQQVPQMEQPKTPQYGNPVNLVQ